MEDGGRLRHYKTIVAACCMDGQEEFGFVAVRKKSGVKT